MLGRSVRLSTRLPSRWGAATSSPLEVPSAFYNKGASSNFTTFIQNMVNGDGVRTQQQHQLGQRRWKHSSRQVKRLFLRNPARLRVEARKAGVTRQEQKQAETEAIMARTPKYPPILEPMFLPNGWCPLPDPTTIDIPKYPFQVARTKNKPNGAVGFLPVYAEFRKDGAKVSTRIKKVSGDYDAFTSELEAVLQLPINKKEESIRIRTGGTIEVKGNRVSEVKRWLAGLGF